MNWRANMPLKKSTLPPLLHKENQIASGKHYDPTFFSEFGQAASGHFQTDLYLYLYEE